MRCVCVDSSSRRSSGAKPPPSGSAVQLTLDLDWGARSPIALPRPRPVERDAEWSEGLPLARCLHDLSTDICAKVPVLSHIDAGQVGFSLSFARNRRGSGTYAFIVPLRFEGGAVTKKHGRRTYTMPPVDLQGREALYLIYLLAPRFFDLPQRRKLHTIIHELYHISPEFDGDLRRFPGRRWAHGPSREAYDETIEGLTELYLTASGGEWPEVTSFLRYSHRDCRRLFGGIRAPVIARPHPVPA